MVVSNQIMQYLNQPTRNLYALTNMLDVVLGVFVKPSKKLPDLSYLEILVTLDAARVEILVHHAPVPAPPIPVFHQDK